MKWLLNQFDRIGKRLFDDGRPLRAARPVFDAAENFFFAPNKRTASGPHVRDPLDVKRFMSMVIIALLPAVAASIYFFGLRVIAVIVVSYAAGGAVEVLFAVIRKEEINEGFLVTGLLFPLVLPPGLPLWMVAVGVAFGVLVGKEVFGGTGRNLFNPAIVGRCFLALAYPKAMTKSSWIAPVAKFPGRLLDYATSAGVDAVSGATPLDAAQEGVWAPLWSMIVGNTSGSAGETPAAALVIGGVFLLLTRVANWRTVAATLGSFVALALTLDSVAAGGLNAAALARTTWCVCAGGLLLGAFFMATDPVTSPITSGGKWMYGIIIGVVTVLIRRFTGYVEGVMFAILLGNIFAPLLDEMVLQVRLRRLRNEE